MANTSEIDHPRFVRVLPDLLKIRLKPGVRIDVECLAGIMRERLRSCGSETLCVLVLVPPDAELDIAVIGLDRCHVNESSEGLRAVALVYGTLMLETMARFYAAYFTQMFQDDAREWLNEQLAGIRQADHKT